ncbi:hypothetical protein AB4543_19765 [Vibrio splendidus]
MKRELDYYNYLMKNINIELPNDYDHQYHYSCLLICAVHFGMNRDITLLLDIIVSQQESCIRNGTYDFVLENVNISLSLTSNMKLKHKIFEVKCRLEREIESKDVKVNYHALDYKYLSLFNSYSNVDDFKRKIYQCASTGCLFDSKSIEGNGIPDLVYHSRNLEILIRTRKTLNLDLDCEISKGINFVYELDKQFGDALFFGRSQFSTYGLGSLYYSLKLSNLSERKLEQSLLLGKMDKIIDGILDSGRLRWSYRLDKKKYGADKYIYPIVYSCFFLSRVILARSELEPMDIKWNSVNIKNLFNTESVNGCKVVYYSGPEITSKIDVSDTRYVANFPLLSYESELKSLVPFFLFSYSPNFSISKKIVIKALNALLSRVFRYINFFIRYSFNSKVFLFGPESLLKENETFRIATLKLPTSTGMTKFIVGINYVKKN